MPTIALRLDPRELNNPDLDIRYVLPEMLVERSGGALSDDGYDYVGECSYIIIYMQTSDVEIGVRCVLDAIETCRVLDNDLRGSIVVAVDHGQGYEIIYPAAFKGTFPA